MRLLFSIVIPIIFCCPVFATTGSTDVLECDSIFQRNGRLVVGTIRFEEPTFFLIYPCGEFVGPGQVIYKKDITEIRWAKTSDSNLQDDYNSFRSLVLRTHPLFASVGLLFTGTAALLWIAAPLIGLILLGLLLTLVGFYLARNQYIDDELSPRVRRRARRSIRMAHLSFAFVISVGLSLLLTIL